MFFLLLHVHAPSPSRQPCPRFSFSPTSSKQVLYSLFWLYYTVGAHLCPGIRKEFKIYQKDHMAWDPEANAEILVLLAILFNVM
jgi:hypothetical protein